MRDSGHVVVTDLSMEGLSGLEVAKAVKTHDPSMPVILLSGWVIQREEERVRTSGVDLVLLKPCPIDELLNAVQKIARVPVGV